MKKANFLKIFKELLPLLILLGYCINLVICAIKGSASFSGEIVDFVPNVQNYLAIILVCLSITSYFASRKHYKYFLIATIIAGFFNIIHFHPFNLTARIGFSNFGIPFQPIAMLTGIIALIVNFKKCYVAVFGNYNETTPQLEEYRNNKFAEAVEKFKEKYTGYSDESLNTIVTENRYMPEALEAAKQVLSEREFNKTA